MTFYNKVRKCNKYNFDDYENDKSKWVSLQADNVYIILGDNITIKNYKFVSEKFEQWVDEKNKIHNGDWCIVTSLFSRVDNQDDDLISLFNCTLLKGIKIFGLDSHWLYCDPDSTLWPDYVSGMLFGKGFYDSVENTEVLKGYELKSHRMTHNSQKNISFFDSEIKSFNNTRGVLVIGGDLDVREQCEIHKLFQIPHRNDLYIATLHESHASPLNAVYHPNRSLK